MSADGDHLWSQTFDRQMQDVFAIQDEITRAIVQALEMQLVGAGDQPVATHGTYNTDAYQLYLQARYHFYKFTGEGFKRCIECCKKALEIEPATHWLMLPYPSPIKLAGITAFSPLKKSSPQSVLMICSQKRQ